VTDIVVAGAGMAGLAAAARARELGARVSVWEKGDHPGGSMLLSSGVVWRYREWDEFRRQCPGGDEPLQRVVHEGVDGAVSWLESLGAPVAEAETGNPLTVGKRFDSRGLRDALVRAAGEDVRLGAPVGSLPDGVPVVLATGGFQASRELVRSHITPEADALLLRSNPWSSGDGMRLGLAAGGTVSAGIEQFYGRAMPAAEVPAGEWVRAAQVYARFAEVVDERGERYDGPVGWAETEVVQWIARRPGARAWFVVGDEAVGELTRYGTVGELIDRARALGARVERRNEGTAVEVVAAITQTLGGLRVDERGRVAPGVWAAGGDVGGVATGGYMSNLAAAVVIGRAAAEDALS
jgi:succinate dehydrogenase/fumarate reductase flavoprotein subunit